MLEDHGLPNHKLGCFVGFLHLSRVWVLGLSWWVSCLWWGAQALLLGLTGGAPAGALVPQDLLGTVTGLGAVPRAPGAALGSGRVMAEHTENLPVHGLIPRISGNGNFPGDSQRGETRGEGWCVQHLFSREKLWLMTSTNPHLHTPLPSLPCCGLCWLLLTSRALVGLGWVTNESHIPGVPAEQRREGAGCCTAG